MSSDTSWLLWRLVPCLFLTLTVIKHVVAVSHVATDEEPQNWENFQLGENEETFYSHVVMDIDGKPHNLSRYLGKVALVVNVASQCGYTDQHYKDLVKLQEQLSPSGYFTVLAFPCNEFGEQEPWGEEEIKSYVRRRYQVNFPVFSKTSVRGHKTPACWHYLTERSGHQPTWNFWKYLVNWEGEVLHAWGPWVDVTSIKPIVQQAVEQASRYKQRPDEL